MSPQQCRHKNDSHHNTTAATLPPKHYHHENNTAATLPSMQHRDFKSIDNWNNMTIPYHNIYSP
jgi:hypothetical protein